jgi:hypothetical protein
MRRLIPWSNRGSISGANEVVLFELIGNVFDDFSVRAVQRSVISADCMSRVSAAIEHGIKIAAKTREKAQRSHLLQMMEVTLQKRHWN